MKYQVKSRFRLTVFITIMIVLTMACANQILGLTPEASGAEVQSYKTIEISSGDTLWTIAEEYMPADMDIREAVDELRALNDMSQTDYLVEGQKITVPEHR